MRLVRGHPMLSFVVLAYAVSWSLVPFGSFLPCGPLVAALVVIPIVQGRDGLRTLGRRLVRWRVGWIWWLAALALPLGTLGLVVVLNIALGASAPSWDQFSSWSAVLLVVGLRLVKPLDGPMGEEPGFRGFAQPHLQRRFTPLGATWLVAVVATGWHLPLLVQGDMTPVDLVSTVAVTFWYAWLFNGSGGSVLITLVAHAAQGVVEHDDLWGPGLAADRLPFLYAAVAAASAFLLVVLDRRRWREARPVGPPEVGTPIVSSHRARTTR